MGSPFVIFRLLKFLGFIELKHYFIIFFMIYLNTVQDKVFYRNILT